MDSFNIHGIKVEKVNAIFRYEKLRKITILFRFMELCVFLILLSRFPIQLPFALKLSGEYLRGLFITLISPRIVFVIGNSIIVVLFLKSGQSSAKDGEKGSKIDVYGEYMDNCRKKNQKQTKSIIRREYSTSCDHMERKIHRSQSEKLGRMEPDRRDLRRSMTERCRKSVNYGKKTGASSCAKEKMSEEEFRRTVEDFIARQQRFLREEGFSAVVS